MASQFAYRPRSASSRKMFRAVFTPGIDPPKRSPAKRFPASTSRRWFMISAGASATRPKGHAATPPDPPARRLRTAAVLPGESVEVPAFGLVKAQDAGERVEDLLGGLGRPALLQAYVVVDADSGQVRDLFAAQPFDPAATVGGDACGRRADPGTPGPRRPSKIVHAPSMAAVRP